VTADKGLCGGFNMATIKTVTKLKEQYEAQGVKVRLRVAGRKGMDYFTFQRVELAQKVNDLSSAPDYDRACDFINESVEDFNNGVTDKVVLVYNGFLNMLTQEIRVRELLPVSLENVSLQNNETSMLDIEPDDDEEVLNELTEKYIDFNIYYALIDSLAAEHSARMQAMEAATKNAKERVETLTIEYNKARQAAITTELIEIISGVESLK
jgi:F-type H+-transporting ATPase subunit gamma